VFVHIQERHMKVSVVIPTLREAERISTLLNALEVQEYAPLEVIVVDAASEDGTAEIVRQHPKVLLVADARRGTSRQRNAGAKIASGELLIFMDADNNPSPHFVRDVVSAYRRWRFAVACPWFVARESWSIRAAYFGFNLLFSLGQSWLRTGSGVCIIARRAAWEQIGGFRDDLHLGEDIDFIRRAARHGWHRHLWVGLETSGRRFQTEGMGKLLWFYARISPYVLLGRWDKLRAIPYAAAPYENLDKKQEDTVETTASSCRTN
jgi:glycosyltransferase involved in cell wall biosynthesis